MNTKRLPIFNRIYDFLYMKSRKKLKCVSLVEVEGTVESNPTIHTIQQTPKSKMTEKSLYGSEEDEEISAYSSEEEDPDEKNKRNNEMFEKGVIELGLLTLLIGRLARNLKRRLEKGCVKDKGVQVTINRGNRNDWGIVKKSDEMNIMVDLAATVCITFSKGKLLIALRSDGYSLRREAVDKYLEDNKYPILSMCLIYNDEMTECIYIGDNDPNVISSIQMSNIYTIVKCISLWDQQYDYDILYHFLTNTFEDERKGLNAANEIVRQK